MPASHRTIIKDQIASFKEVPQDKKWKPQIDRIRPPTEKDKALAEMRFNAFLLRAFGTSSLGIKNSPLHFVLDTGEFTETVLSVGYVKEHYPDTFKKNSALLEARFEEIHVCLQQVFRDRPDELFNWRDDCYTSEFYSFLKALETFEQMLPSAEERLSAIFQQKQLSPDTQHHYAPALLK